MHILQWRARSDSVPLSLPNGGGEQWTLFTQLLTMHFHCHRHGVIHPSMIRPIQHLDQLGTIQRQMSSQVTLQWLPMELESDAAITRNSSNRLNKRFDPKRERAMESTNQCTMRA